MKVSRQEMQHGCKVCIHLVHDKVQWRPLLDMVINQRVSHMSGRFLASWWCVSFSRASDQYKANFISFYLSCLQLVVDLQLETSWFAFLIMYVILLRRQFRHNTYLDEW
jgi:hypothetical protein